MVLRIHPGIGDLGHNTASCLVVGKPRDVCIFFSRLFDIEISGGEGRKRRGEKGRMKISPRRRDRSGLIGADRLEGVRM